MQCLPDLCNCIYITEYVTRANQRVLVSSDCRHTQTKALKVRSLKASCTVCTRVDLAKGPMLQIPMPTVQSLTIFPVCASELDLHLLHLCKVTTCDMPCKTPYTSAAELSGSGALCLEQGGLHPYPFRSAVWAADRWVLASWSSLFSTMSTYSFCAVLEAVPEAAMALHHCTSCCCNCAATASAACISSHALLRL